MGKGQRSRAARAEEMALKKIAAKKKAKRDKITKITVSVVSAVLAVSIIGGIIFSAVRSHNKENGTYLKRDVAMQSTNYTISNAMMFYYFQNYYSAFVSENSNYLQYYGLDASKSLKSQDYPGTTADGGSQSWYDYLMSATTAQVKQLLVLAEAAKEAGVTLDDSENENITTTLKSITPSDIVPGLTEDEVRTCLELGALAEKYKAEVQDGIECTDDDINTYYNENKNNYDTVDYRMYSFSYKNDDSSEDNGATLTKEQAKKLADELAATKNETEYLNWLKKYFTDTLKVENVQNELDGTKTTDFAYSESYEGIDFLFGESAKAGDIKLVESEADSLYKVFLLLTPRHRDETKLKNVRHILFKASDSDDAAMKEAKQKAEQALETWKKNGATEDAFAKLATEKTEDTGSASTGGLYSNVHKGDMVESFENWTYDAARKPGDTGIIESTYGYHVMYFVGDGDIEWKHEVKDDFVAEKYEEKYNTFTEKYVITQNDNKIAKIADYIP